MIDMQWIANANTKKQCTSSLYRWRNKNKIVHNLYSCYWQNLVLRVIRKLYYTFLRQLFFNFQSSMVLWTYFSAIHRYIYTISFLLSLWSCVLVWELCLVFPSRRAYTTAHIFSFSSRFSSPSYLYPSLYISVSFYSPCRSKQIALN